MLESMLCCLVWHHVYPCANCTTKYSVYSAKCLPQLHVAAIIDIDAVGIGKANALVSQYLQHYQKIKVIAVIIRLPATATMPMHLRMSLQTVNIIPIAKVST